MPWDITIFSGTSPDDSTLGPRDAVVSQLAAALPRAQLEQPPSVPEEFLAQMPESVRAVINRPKFEGCFEHPEFSISFYCGAGDTIDTIGGEVRGNGNPLAALKHLCDSTGWSVFDCMNQRAVDFSDVKSNGWDDFCQWRDRAFSQLDDQP